MVVKVTNAQFLQNIMMDYFRSAFGLMGDYALLLGPGAGIVLGGLILVATVEKFFRARPAFAQRHALFRGVTSLFILSCAIIWSIFLLPIDHDTRAQLVTLLAVVISAVLTLSSTTFVGNALAGLLLQVISEFRPGDMIKVDDTIGRVAEEGVFHTEIQTVDGALITIPNLLLVTTPVTVMRSGKTVIDAEVSLGYDVPHTLAERALALAAEATGLKEPFVQITSLGDYSIAYRCAGFLEDVSTYFGAKAQLRANMVDLLHEHGIEITSPMFVSRRAIDNLGPTIPDPPSYRHALDSSVATGPRATVVFDLAERAAAKEGLKQRIDALGKESKTLKEKISATTDELEKRHLERILERNRAYEQYLSMRLDESEVADVNEKEEEL